MQSRGGSNKLGNGCRLCKMKAMKKILEIVLEHLIWDDFRIKFTNFVDFEPDYKEP